VRSAGDMLRWTIVALVVAAAPQPIRLAAQEQPPARIQIQPAEADIAEALTRVKADPNLNDQRTIKMLRWKDSTTAKRQKSPTWAWLVGLFRWVDQSARVLMWCAIAVLAALLAFYLGRVFHRPARSAREEAFVIPTHVGDLDIRPEALPGDIGAAARLLWDRGDHRLALALLYRGLLSRLAHVHHVPIRDASTEGDCLALAVRHVPLRMYEYAARLVNTWQQFVYGRLDVQSESVHRLCDEFAAQLDLAAGANSAAQEGAR
jgi:Domain of unknown function (DUF4129)